MAVLENPQEKQGLCTGPSTANSKANAVYNVLHIPEEDVILKYSDD